MKTLKITEQAYEILSTIKWSSRSKTFSEVIIKMDKAIQESTPKDFVLNRYALKGIKLNEKK